jgi:hypothetical protein
MHIAPGRVTPPLKRSVVENHDTFDRAHGPASRKEEIQEFLVGHSARLHGRAVQPVPLAPRLGGHTKDLLGKDTCGVVMLGVMELDSRSLVPYEACPRWGLGFAWQGADLTVGFRCTSMARPGGEGTVVVCRDVHSPATDGGRALRSGATVSTYATYASLRTFCVRWARSRPQIRGFASHRFAPVEGRKRLQRGEVRVTSPLFASVETVGIEPTSVIACGWLLRA